MIDLEAVLRARRDEGGRSFVPYVTGGLPGVDAGLLQALRDEGADAIEVGIPFSDPVMDGGVIQQASAAALAAGAHPSDILAMIAKASLDIPVAVMTYVNPVYRRGFEDFLAEAAGAGVAAAIVPDLPVDEADEWIRSSVAHDVQTVFLAAPGTSADRLAAIAAASRGFVYCVATYGVTGARTELAGTARLVVEALRPLTDLPLLVGVGIATPDQAGAACAFADGVIVGSALMAPMLAGDAEGAVGLARAFRAQIPVGG
ncbi:MAG: tryptophan synthase subunit alpha [Actinomycetota bacterium]